MSGLDSLLSEALNSRIKNKLDKNTLVKVEQRLLEKYGVNLAQSTKDFTKLDNILREFFGDGTDLLEKQFLENIINIQEPNAPNIGWITIEDPALTKLILETFTDEDKKNIISNVLDEPRIISEIIEIIKISQTSGYRKVNSLIDTGFLIEHSYITINGGKKVNKYISILENFEISIEKNKVSVKVKLAKESIRKSSLLKVVCCVPNPR